MKNFLTLMGKVAALLICALATELMGFIFVAGVAHVDWFEITGGFVGGVLSISIFISILWKWR